MEKDTTYYLHQTPSELAKDLIALLPIKDEDVLYEPFKGEGAFYNNFPIVNKKDWSEITEGRDYTTYEGEYDWVITNPPFTLPSNGKRINSFWYLLDYYSERARTGIAFLGNDNCFSVLTPKRMELLKTKGWSLTKLCVCSIKKWRGRYYFFVFQKNSNSIVQHLLPNY